MEYAMYKGDDLLHIGTLDEIARERGVLRDTIYFYTTEAYKRRISRRKKARNYITMTRLDDES